MSGLWTRFPESVCPCPGRHTSSSPSSTVPCGTCRPQCTPVSRICDLHSDAGPPIPIACPICNRWLLECVNNTFISYHSLWKSLEDFSIDSSQYEQKPLTIIIVICVWRIIVERRPSVNRWCIFLQNCEQSISRLIFVVRKKLLMQLEIIVEKVIPIAYICTLIEPKKPGKLCLNQLYCTLLQSLISETAPAHISKATIYTRHKTWYNKKVSKYQNDTYNYYYTKFSQTSYHKIKIKNIGKTHFLPPKPKRYRETHGHNIHTSTTALLRRDKFARSRLHLTRGCVYL